MEEAEDTLKRFIGWDFDEISFVLNNCVNGESEEILVRVAFAPMVGLVMVI
jgi:hypothetical protein